MSRVKLPAPPELPAAVRPAWPAWNAPLALLAAPAATVAAGLPLLPAVLLLGFSDVPAAPP